MPSPRILPRPVVALPDSLTALLATSRAGTVVLVEDPLLVRALVAAGATVIVVRPEEEACPPGRASAPRPEAPCHVPALTAREAQVVRLACEGIPSGGIAIQLGIGVRTVETHLDHAYRKLGVRSRAELRAAVALAS